MIVCACGCLRRPLFEYVLSAYGLVCVCVGVCMCLFVGAAVCVCLFVGVSLCMCVLCLCWLCAR